MSELTRDAIRGYTHRFHRLAQGTNPGDHVGLDGVRDMALRTHDAEADNADLRQRLQEAERQLASREEQVHLAGKRANAAERRESALRQALGQIDAIACDFACSDDHETWRAMKDIHDIARDSAQSPQAEPGERCPECGKPAEWLEGRDAPRWRDGRDAYWRCPDCQHAWVSQSTPQSKGEGFPRATTGEPYDHTTDAVRYLMAPTEPTGEALRCLDELVRLPEPENSTHYDWLRQHLQREEQAQAGVPEVVHAIPKRMREQAAHVGGGLRNGLLYWAAEFDSALAAHSNEGSANSGGQIPDSIRRVMDEMAAARSKFPQWPTDPIHAVTVVQEEAGELSQAVLQSVYEPSKADYSHAEKEAIQTAAMAIRFLENMPRYHTPHTTQHDDDAAPQSERDKGE